MDSLQDTKLLCVTGVMRFLNGRKESFVHTFVLAKFGGAAELRYFVLNEVLRTKVMMEENDENENEIGEVENEEKGLAVEEMKEDVIEEDEDEDELVVNKDEDHIKANVKVNDNDNDDVGLREEKEDVVKDVVGVAAMESSISDSGAVEETKEGWDLDAEGEAVGEEKEFENVRSAAPTSSFSWASLLSSPSSAVHVTSSAGGGSGGGGNNANVSASVRGTPGGSVISKGTFATGKASSSSSSSSSKVISSSTTATAAVSTPSVSSSTPPPPAGPASNHSHNNSRQRGGAGYGGCSFYIRDIPPSVTETQLDSVFSKYNHNIFKINCNTARRFAFIDFTDPNAADDILARAVADEDGVKTGRGVEFTLDDGVKVVAEKKKINHQNSWKNGGKSGSGRGNGNRFRNNNNNDRS